MDYSDEMEEPPFRSFFPTVLLVTTLGFLVSDLYAPSLPAIEVGLKTSESLVQLTLSLYLLAVGLVQLLYGPFSDRWGRRNVLLVGMIVSLVGLLGCIVAWNIYALLIARILQGLGLGVCPAVGRAIVRDVYSGERLPRVGSYSRLNPE